MNFWLHKSLCQGEIAVKQNQKKKKKDSEQYKIWFICFVKHRDKTITDKSRSKGGYHKEKEFCDCGWMILNNILPT